MDMLSSRTLSLLYCVRLLPVLSLAHFFPPNKEGPLMHVGVAPHWYLMKMRRMYSVLVFHHV